MTDISKALGFSDEDRAAIARAIAEAEQTTSGEIVVVASAASDGYRSFGLLWSALVALAVPLPLIYFTGWSLDQVYVAELVAFFVLAAISQIPAVRYRLVPPFIRREVVHRAASEQFLAQNLHTTDGRTGILIYVSFAEHIAEVIADEGIYAKVDEAVWDEIVARLTGHLGRGHPREAFLEAIEKSGAVLAEHFPPGAIDHNELPNHLIVLDGSRP
ncbi:hypothetical protein V6C03_04185 [Methyloligella sp. 2.7D]|uniref:TPM domain-containing protein n=1 Tax=unclassified Methyloligella TaxID=2625955 RepID=UPI00157C2B10|nr:hypothetical protein [Methyloligella sp. GL2]QKP76197.1 hypothetical protein HT051_01245 [Methyloligella sp. GL2]